MRKKIFTLLLFFVFSILVIQVEADTQPTTYYLQVSFAENPVAVAPGSSGFIELDLENIGTGTVSYIDISINNLDYPTIKRSGNWDNYVGSLDGGKSTSIFYEFKVPSSATSGLYQIVFVIDSNVGESKHTAFIRVEDSTVLDLTSVSPSSINIGEVSTLTFNISNSGGKSIENLDFSWDDINDLILPLGSDNKIKIDEIPANNFTDISFDVMVSPSRSAGVYPLLITMEYYDETDTKQILSSKVGIQVCGSTDFELVLQSSNSGNTFAVANTGANTASSVIVSIPLQPGYSTTGASSVSLGNLNAGDYTLATFQITSSDVNTTKQPKSKQNSEKMPSDLNQTKMQGMMRNFSAGSNLVVEISYTDLFGLRQTVEKEVSLASFSSVGDSKDSASRKGMTGESSGIDSGTMYIIIGIVGIILIVAILKISKSKKILEKIRDKKK